MEKSQNANMGINFFMDNPGAKWQDFLNQLANTPCAKTKALIEGADVKPKLEQLYTKAKSIGGGELGFMIKNNGTPTDMIPGGWFSIRKLYQHQRRGGIILLYTW